MRHSEGPVSVPLRGNVSNNWTLRHNLHAGDVSVPLRGNVNNDGIGVTSWLLSLTTVSVPLRGNVNND